MYMCMSHCLLKKIYGLQLWTLSFSIYTVHTMPLVEMCLLHCIDHSLAVTSSVCMHMIVILVFVSYLYLRIVDSLGHFLEWCHIIRSGPDSNRLQRPRGLGSALYELKFQLADLIDRGCRSMHDDILLHGDDESSIPSFSRYCVTYKIWSPFLGKTSMGGMQSFIGLWYALYISLAKFIRIFWNIHDLIKVWCNIKWENLNCLKIAKSAFESNLTLQGRETKTIYNLFTVL